MGRTSIVVLLALAAGCAPKPTAPTPKTQAAPVLALPPTPAAPAPAAADAIDRYAIPLGGPARGPAAATIEIVEFSDFQCPFCSRVVPTLERLLKEYPTVVRLHFRHNPLNFHPHAALAAEAAVAAEAQGKFWEMHDRLFAHQDELDRPGLENHARALGLDLAKFRAALDGRTGRARVDEDLAIVKKFGVQGTPVFFINGIELQGAQPYAEFKRAVDAELAHAAELLTKGTPRERLYETLMANAATARAPAKPNPIGVKPSDDVYKIAPGNAPRRGGKTPKVTIIEFSDFQCPFCARVEGTLTTLLRDYGDDLQLVYKHNPLPFHNRAMPAALAAEAARQQDRFWEMHDKLLEDQQALDDDGLRRHARELGLDMKRFEAALRDPATKKRVEDDMDEALTFGARGTPNFFINGRNFRGAQPIEAFRAVVDAEVVAADAKLKAGTPRAQLYAALTANGLEKATPPAPTQRKGDPDPNVRMRAPVDGAPARGPAGALVTIVEWSDFQCPFCKRVEPTLAKVLDRWKGDVRLVWRDLPLPFHKEARPAARAARAAGAQGKFWEMHDKLFADQEHLDKDTFVRHARALGLNLRKFEAALDSEKIDDAIDDDAAAAAKIGARGTPSFFINGKFVSGAQPFELFETKIEAELEEARALVAKGTPRKKVYEALMRDATEEIEAAADSGDDEKAGPEKDETVYKVVPGDAPSRGPANAALVVVEYADFECPFCRRLEPTLAQLQKAYPNNVRVVWKNYPLPFHANAEPAAQAALAAGAQGKFWEMHDKLLAEGATLDREGLEGYAKALGLDLARFRADLEAKRYDARIRAELSEGQAVGVSGTPTVFINGRKVSGAYPFATFQAVAAQELRRLGARPAAKPARP